MVSVCCGDCRTEKLKSDVFNKILLNEHCKNISEYLGCDDCIKMNAILNDPIYKTLDPEQQQIFKVIKLFPLPDDFDDFIIYSNEFNHPHHKPLNAYIRQLNQTDYEHMKDLYDHLYIQNYYLKNKRNNKRTKPIIFAEPSPDYVYTIFSSMYSAILKGCLKICPTKKPWNLMDIVMKLSGEEGCKIWY